MTATRAVRSYEILSHQKLQGCAAQRQYPEIHAALVRLVRQLMKLVVTPTLRRTDSQLESGHEFRHESEVFATKVRFALINYVAELPTDRGDGGLQNTIVIAQH